MKLEIRKAIMAILLFCMSSAFVMGQDGPANTKLKDGDVVAICGDSITSNGRYPLFVEAYHFMCGPSIKVKFINFGRWGWRAVKFYPTIDDAVLPSKPTVVTFCYGMNSARGTNPLSLKSNAAWKDIVGKSVQKFRAAGVREFVLSSPGVVDSYYFKRGSATKAPTAEQVATTQHNLKGLGDEAKKIAKEEKVTFVDLHSSMMAVMKKAKKKYGKTFAFAGGMRDGIHPREAGHLVMAHGVLKGLGYSGNIGEINIDLKNKKSSGSLGHKVISLKGQTVEIESTRYPFCFYKSKGKLNHSSTRSVVDMFPFNDDLNRFILRVQGASSAQVKVTWGASSKVFKRSEIEKGINLAAAFMDENPFKAPFAKIYAAMNERNRVLSFLTRKVHQNDGMRKRLAREVAKIKITPVRHQIIIEEVK